MKPKLLIFLDWYKLDDKEKLNVYLNKLNYFKNLSLNNETFHTLAS